MEMLLIAIAGLCVLIPTIVGPLLKNSLKQRVYESTIIGRSGDTRRFLFSQQIDCYSLDLCIAGFLLISLVAFKVALMWNQSKGSLDNTLTYVILGLIVCMGVFLSVCVSFLLEGHREYIKFVNRLTEDALPENLVAIEEDFKMCVIPSDETARMGFDFHMHITPPDPPNVTAAGEDDSSFRGRGKIPVAGDDIQYDGNLKVITDSCGLRRWHLQGMLVRPVTGSLQSLKSKIKVNMRLSTVLSIIFLVCTVALNVYFELSQVVPS